MRKTRRQRQADRINYCLGTLLLILSGLVAYAGIVKYGW
jgi:hypothetical protein